MPTKSRIPSPNPTITSQKPRKRESDVTPGSVGSPGSEGGIILEKSKSQGKKDLGMSSASKVKASADPSAKDGGPNRQRRRPRKLTREPVVEKASDSVALASKVSSESLPPASTTELEALKSRVRGLEAKVEELYNAGVEGRSGRSPRRRGKGRKGSNIELPRRLSTTEPQQVEEEEADEELGRLEDELEVARRDLETFAPRPRTKRTTSEETEYVEEIPRGEVGAEEVMTTGNRQVTLTGNYRIPLPATVSMSDVKSIQTGVSAAQNVARSFLEQRRANQAQSSQDSGRAKAPTPTAAPKTKARPKAKAKPATTSKEVSTTVAQDDEGKKSWVEWFGGYSMAISRAVKTIEAEAAIESQKQKPAQPKRTASAPSTKTPKSAAKAGTAIASKSGKRPPLKPRASNLSNEQVQGLMK